MGAKRIAFDDEARQAIRRGVSRLAKTVKVTLGPRGRNVMIERGIMSPLVTKDGVTVAKELEFKDSWENMGAQMVKEVASKTSDGAGDGTTTATVLAEAIFERGLVALQSGVQPVLFKRGIEHATRAVVEQLRSMSVDVEGRDHIAQIGTIAANNDPTIGEVLARAMEKVGKDGVITVEEGKSLETEVTVVEMMDQILPGTDKDVVRVVEKHFTKGDNPARVLTKAKAKSVSVKKGKAEVVVEVDGKDEKLKADKVLVAVGFRPNTQGLGLEHVADRAHGHAGQQRQASGGGRKARSDARTSGQGGGGRGVVHARLRSSQRHQRAGGGGAAGP